jgi:single-stranded-DNA-specific exonuclease
LDELYGCGNRPLNLSIGAHYGETTEEFTGLSDLVVVAIAADIVPINGENRNFKAYFGSCR